MQKFKTSGTEFEKLATHVSGVVLSPSCFVFFLRKQRKLPAMRKAMTIKPPGTLKCPRLPLPTSQSISVSVAATTCQQCQGYHHTAMVGLLVSPFAQNTNSRKLHPYQGKIRSKKGAYKSLGNSQRKKEGGGGRKTKQGLHIEGEKYRKKETQSKNKTPKRVLAFIPANIPAKKKKTNPKHQFP